MQTVTHSLSLEGASLSTLGRVVAAGEATLEAMAADGDFTPDWRQIEADVAYARSILEDTI